MTFKRPLQLSFFNVLHQIFNAQGKDSKNIVPTSICDSLLRDTFYRAVECDPQFFQTVLQNISTFIEIVYFQGYSSDLMTCEIHFFLSVVIFIEFMITPCRLWAISFTLSSSHVRRQYGGIGLFPACCDILRSNTAQQKAFEGNFLYICEAKP
jgi:hypothetical protein